ncbi:MAG: diguanylate cyclase, partial [Christensenellaceae bacterium]|nr:diguanylate cyclase [Christensenellaceae bacterium]
MKKNFTHPASCDTLADKVIANSPNIILRISKATKKQELLFASGNFASLGYESEDFLSGNYEWHKLIHPDDLATMSLVIHKNEKTLTDSYSLQYRIRKNNGEYKWVNDFITITRDSDGNAIFSDNFISDYTEMKESFDKITYHTRWQDVFNDIIDALEQHDVDSALDIILARAGGYLDLTRIIVLETGVAEDRNLKTLHVWRSEQSTDNTLAVNDIIDYAPIPEIREQILNQGQCVVEYQSATENVRNFLDKINSKCAVVCAIYMNKNLYGVVIFDECKSTRKWQKQDVRFCDIITHFISEVFTQKTTELALVRSENIMATILNNIPSYLYVIDSSDNELVFANAAYIRDFVDNKTASANPNLLRDAISNVAVKSSSTPNLSSFSEVDLEELDKRFGVHSNTITWIDGSQKQLFTCVDLSEKWQHDQFIKRIAYYDHLTGLGNRYNCDVVITDVIENARASKKSGYVVFMDLDNFKFVNDQYGHDYGDALLIAFANYLKGDAVPVSYSIFRFGGDEFVILVPTATQSEIVALAEQIIQRAQMPWVVKNKTFSCTLSIGIAEFPKHGKSCKDLIKKADTAMYEAKRLGKNNYVFYTKQLPDVSYELTRLELLMRRSIKNGFSGFQVCFVVDESDKKPMRAYANLRWIQESGEVLNYDDFKSAAEYMGLIFVLGEFLITESLKILKHLNDTYSSDFKLSIPLSLKQLQNMQFPDQISRAMQTTAVNPDNVLFDLGNGQDVDECIHMLYVGEQIRDLGASVVMCTDRRFARALPQYVLVRDPRNFANNPIL